MYNIFYRKKKYQLNTIMKLVHVTGNDIVMIHVVY